MKVGVLIFNLGGPESLAEVRPFLYQLFSDPEIIRIPVAPVRKLVAYLIAALRHRKSTGYYAQIGGGSPLRRLTEDQGRALESELRRRGREASVVVGMCTWKPFLPDAVEAIEAGRPDRLVVLPLFPQFSVTTTGAGLNIIKTSAKRSPFLKSLDVRYVRAWPVERGYIEAMAQAIEREAGKSSNPDGVTILFSAHSIPESYVRNGDPYLDQTRQTMEAIMDRLGRRNPYRLAFQSKIGPVKWLEPMTNDVIAELARGGKTSILIVPISFVSEHIETLYELDILYKKEAAVAGVTEFLRVPALNSDPLFIAALADIVESQLTV